MKGPAFPSAHSRRGPCAIHVAADAGPDDRVRELREPVARSRLGNRVAGRYATCREQVEMLNVLQECRFRFVSNWNNGGHSYGVAAAAVIQTQYQTRIACPVKGGGDTAKYAALSLAPGRTIVWWTT